MTYERLLKTFWENHDPTQGYRQGNDVGNAVPLGDLRPRRGAAGRRDSVTRHVSSRSWRRPATDDHDEIREAPAFYFAEDYDQQYLAKVPNGYCPNHATGVTLPADFAVTPLQYVD